MAKFGMRGLSAIKDQVESWGIRLPTARGQRRATPQLYVHVSLEWDGEAILVGRLSQEVDEFVFRYDREFASREDAFPIGAFPDLEEEYRSEELWPFFAVRIPPVAREDVRAALKQQAIREDQTLEILGSLAKRSVSNSYELKLSEAY